MSQATRSGRTLRLHLLGLRAQCARWEALVLQTHSYRVRPLIAQQTPADLSVSRMDRGLTVLELTLAPEPALALVAQLRGLDAHARILLTGVGEGGQTCVQAYEAGADVCHPQAVEPAELHAMLLAQSRRIRTELALRLPGHLDFDARKLQVTGAAGTVLLSGSEARVLSALVTSPAKTLDYLQLRRISGGYSTAQTRLSVMICRLRRKLRLAGALGPCLVSLRRTSYQLLCPVRLVSPELNETFLP